MKILSIPMSDSDMADLKAKLIEFLSERLTKEVDAAFKAKGYTKEIYKTWKKEHMRRRANPIKFEA